MKALNLKLKPIAALLLALVPGWAAAFDSGSTGADGAFSPTVNTTVQLPPGGIFNYTTFTIPTGVTVTYVKNTANTPVVILASGNVTIAGTLSVGGSAAADVGAAGSGNQGDDGVPGKGGPGGYDGGKGSAPNANFIFAGAGMGPGGGNGGLWVPAGNNCVDGSGWGTGGTGGGFGAAAAASPRSSFSCGGGGVFTYTFTQPQGGVAYGSSVLLPLVGGSGGGGGAGGLTFDGGGGGGGGGAILIASSGTVTVTGSLLANGGNGGSGAGAGIGGAGGGGAGGAIRIMASTLAGNGTISAAGGTAGSLSGQTQTVFAATQGAQGRIRFEADTITRTAAANPLASADTPGSIFVAGFPTLTISSVAGVNAPASPIGIADITLPASTPNPVTVVFTTTNVPVGNTVLLKVIPQIGNPISALSPALTGSTANATASVPVNLPVGPSVLQAQTTFTIVASLGDALRNFAGNERVEKVTLMATLGGGPARVRLITVSGKEYEAPAEALRLASLGG